MMRSVCRASLLVCASLAPAFLFGQGRGPAPPPTGHAGAVIDLTGYWVSIVDEDWRWRMVTAPKGDFASVPLNAEGRRVGGLWDPARTSPTAVNAKLTAPPA